MGTCVVMRFCDPPMPYRGVVVGHSDGLNRILFEDDDCAVWSTRYIQTHPDFVSIHEDTVARAAAFDEPWHLVPDWFHDYDPRSDGVELVTAAALELGPGSLTLYCDPSGRSRPALILTVFPLAGTHTAWCKDPSNGVMFFAWPAGGLRTYRPEDLNAPWVVRDSPPVLASAPASLVGAALATHQHALRGRLRAPPFPRRPPGAHHGAKMACHACHSALRPADFPLRCLGSHEPGAHVVGCHQLPRYYCLECLSHDGTHVTLGPRGQDVARPCHHADWAGWQCPDCTFFDAFGRLPVASERDAVSRTCGLRAATDACFARAASSTSNYASVWARLLIIEERLGVPLIQRKPTDPPIPPSRMRILLEYYEEALTPTVGNGPKAGALSLVATVLGHVASLWSVPNPMASEYALRVLRGMRVRLGCVVQRAKPFTVALLKQFLAYMTTLPDTIENLTLSVIAIVSVFGFLRISEALRLRRRHYSHFPRIRFPHIMLELEFCKQDAFAVGSQVLISDAPLCGIPIAAYVDRLLTRLAALRGAPIGPASLLFTLPSGRAISSSWVLSHMRTHLTAMQTAGEPLLANVDVVKDFTTKSFKRGGAASATAATTDIAAVQVHGWVTRRGVENLKRRNIVETYTDIEDALQSIERRHRVTHHMGVDRPAAAPLA